MAGRLLTRLLLRKWFKRFREFFQNTLSLLLDNTRKVRRNTQELERKLNEQPKDVKTRAEVTLSLLTLGGVVAFLYPYLKDLVQVNVSFKEDLPTREAIPESRIEPNEQKEFLLSHTAASEGGYANIKADRGGETYRGISRRANPKWEGWKIIDEYKAKYGPIKNKAIISNAQLDIYVDRFWSDYYNRSQAGEIKNILLASHYLRLYAGAPSKARNLVRDAIAQVIPDFVKSGTVGRFSEEELAVLNGPKASEIAEALIGVRTKYYETIVENNPSQKVFLKGWLADVEKTTVAANEFVYSKNSPQAVSTMEVFERRDIPERHKWKGKNVGHMVPLLEVMSRNGINFTVTSGYRKGSLTASGRRSWHSQGMAVDIKPSGSETWESLKRKIVTIPEVLQYFKDNRLGVYDETTSEILRLTGGSGPHLHIGPDNVAVLGLSKLEQQYKNDILSKEEISEEYPDWFGGMSMDSFDSYKEVGAGNQQIPYK